MKNCNKCGKQITGDYVEALSHFWHPHHFLCGICRKPIIAHEFSIRDGIPYHDECFEDRMQTKCSICNKPINGSYTIDAWERTYCSSHEREYAHCDYCGGFVSVTAHEGRLNNEIIRCSSCINLAVETIEELAPIAKTVIRWVHRMGLSHAGKIIKLQLLNVAELNKHLARQVNSHSLGITFTEHRYELLNRGKTRIDVKGIGVLKGLPAPLCYGVLAHELGHVWIVKNGITGLPSWLEEGFCEYLAYRYYCEHQVQGAKYFRQCIEHNKDPVYGEGFRKIKRRIENDGLDSFMNGFIKKQFGSKVRLKEGFNSIIQKITS